MNFPAVQKKKEKESHTQTYVMHRTGGRRKKPKLQTEGKKTGAEPWAMLRGDAP